MASTGSAVTLTLGAALGAGWASTLGKAKGDIGMIGTAIAKIGDQQKGLDLPDFKGHEKNTAALADAKLALQNYRQKIGETNEPTEEQTAILAHLTKEHEKAEKAYQRSEAAIKRQTIALKAEGKDVVALTRENEQLAESKKKLITLGTALGKTRQAWGEFWKPVAKGIGVITALTAVSYKFVNATAAEGEAINQASSRLGMSVPVLQEFRFAAEQSGMGAEKFEGGLDKLSQGLDDALIKKSGPAHDALSRMGLDMRALSTMPADERLLAVSDALAGIANTDTRASLLSDLFGKDAGRGFNTMLSGGRKAIEQMRQQARESGAVWDTSGAEAYQSSLGALRASWASLGRIIGTTLMPAFTKLNTTLRNVITGNGGAVGKSLGTLVNALSGLAPLVGGVARVAGFLFGLIGKAPWLVNTLVFALGVLGYTMLALKFGTLITSIISLGRTFVGVIPLITGFNVALTANPIGIVIVAIGLLAAGIYALWKNFGAINAWLDEHPIFDGILRVVFPIIGLVRIIRRHWEPIVGFFKWVGSGIAWYFATAWENIKTSISFVWDLLKRVFSWSPLGLVVRAYGAMFDWLERKFGIFTKLGGAIKAVGGWLGFGKAEEPGEVGSIGTSIAKTAAPVIPAVTASQTQDTGSAKSPSTTSSIPDVTPIMQHPSENKTVNSSVSVNIQQQPGENQDSLVRRVIAAIDQQQSALLDGALADPA
ncbi:hypothetical protein Ga0100231_024185 [Opitutaceae bacterium TAV4]|nr:hypothetical protein Ga0100231_024185 [Opitutaceae bacterium TAV4]RRK00811.1 hypothetical protein Ga0100230_023760 [Opitutaceae bacterium TAV3]